MKKSVKEVKLMKEIYGVELSMYLDRLESRWHDNEVVKVSYAELFDGYDYYVEIERRFINDLLLYIESNGLRSKVLMHFIEIVISEYKHDFGVYRHNNMLGYELDLKDFYGNIFEMVKILVNEIKSDNN